MGITPAQYQQLKKKLGVQSQGIQSTIKKGSIISTVCNPGPSADVEQRAGYAPVPEERTTLKYSGKCTVRLKAFRKRLVDPDGNCLKYFIDFLRYCGAIKEDNDAAVRIVFEGQEKVGSEAEERCEITVEYPEVDLDDLWERRKA